MNKFVINITTLRNNINIIKHQLKPNVKFCAMVKANAYGHGAKLVAKHIHDIVDYFGVACVKEALVLRRNNIPNQILVVGAFDPKTAKQALINDVQLTVCSVGDLLVLNNIAKQLNIIAKVHIKINTGMNRLGVDNIQDFKQMLEFVNNNKNILLVGVFSHFSCSDSDDKFTAKQNAKFKKFIKLVKDNRVIFHISSSCMATSNNKYNYDMVRVGIAMYGYCWEIGVKPVVSIYSNICAINYVPKKQSIGYSATYKTTSAKIIATVPLGYADGLNLKLSNRLMVYINNKPCKIVGRICMDMFMCDITGVNAKLGDKVTVFDPINNAKVWRYYCDSSEYEILTNFKTSRMRVVIEQ